MDLFMVPTRRLRFRACECHVLCELTLVMSSPIKRAGTELVQGDEGSSFKRVDRSNLTVHSRDLSSDRLTRTNTTLH